MLALATTWPGGHLPRETATMLQNALTDPPAQSVDDLPTNWIPTHESAKPPPPTRVLNLITGFRRSKTMFAAVSLGIFNALASGGKSCGTLATNFKLDPDALERLLDACVGLKLLQYDKDKDLYGNTDDSKHYLCSKSPLTLSGYIHASNNCFWQLWERLEGEIREGTNRYKQAFNFDGPFWAYLFKTKKDKEQFRSGTHGFGQITSPNLVKAFPLGGYKTLVNLGGGTGHFAIAACTEYKDLEAEVFEIEDACEDAKRTIAAAPESVRNRIKVTKGDFFSDELPEADLYCLARILHDWPEDKILALLKKVFDRLKPDGTPDCGEVAQRRSVRPGLGSDAELEHVSNRPGKGADGLAQYRELLRKADFGQVQVAITDSPLDCILAEKLPGEQEPPKIKTIVDYPAVAWRNRAPFADEAAMYWAFFEHAGVGFVLADLDGNLLLVNKAFADIVGRTVSETRQINYKALTPEGCADEDAEQMDALRLHRSIGPFAKQYVFPDKKTLVSVRVRLEAHPDRR